MITKKRRKRIIRLNRFVDILSKIYNVEYKEVQRIYNRFNEDIVSTKSILRLKAL